MDDTRISLPEEYRLQGLVQRAQTMADLDIYPITRWRLTAACSAHGQQVLEFETTEQLPAEIANGYLRCETCLYERNLVRWLPILDSKGWCR